MMDVSRHKSIDVLRGYVRDADAFQDYAGAGLLWRRPPPLALDQRLGPLRARI
jgi:hypothetical protein